MSQPENDLQAALLAGDHIHAISEELRNQLAKLTAVMGDVGDKTAHYGRALSAASGQLGVNTEPGQIKTLVEGLVAATRLMEQHNRNLEQQLKQSNDEVGMLKARVEMVRREAMTDALTGLSNRKAFDVTLMSSVIEAERTGDPVTLLIGDVDHFKTFNDSYGHQVGDHVLRLVAKCLTDSIKGRDTAARYGGEEFAVILPGTSVANARIVADQIRRIVASKKIIKRSTNESFGTVTISIGAAAWRKGDNPNSLIERADACLYAAKRSGRNRVVTELDIDATKGADAEGRRSA
ncbi:MAG: GGDEF domain-containing protein [Alphaproteobacteria bacterium]|nr:GGDEF domain-containing protein [Alphaproteobacteria bacterium]